MKQQGFSLLQVPPPDLFLAGVLCLEVSAYVYSQIRLREFNIFDEAVLLMGCTGKWYGRASPIPMLVKIADAFLCVLSSPRCVENYLNDFYYLEISYYYII
jgi:hypothetical protein